MKAHVQNFKTLSEMLKHTVSLYSERPAYWSFNYEINAWESVQWSAFYQQVIRWQKAFQKMGLVKGDRVAMLLVNNLDALTFDQAALASGLVPVPLHAIDTAPACAYILQDSNAKFLVTSTLARWNAILATGESFPDLKTVVFTNDDETDTSVAIPHFSKAAWLDLASEIELNEVTVDENDLAGLIYTSGTTGRPKGVMMTHKNLLSNVQQLDNVLDFDENDLFLSYLPLSHTFERTVSYYNALAHGAALAFARSVNHLGEDLVALNPTIMCSVPRVYERFYAQLREKIAAFDQSHAEELNQAIEHFWAQFALDNGIKDDKTALTLCPQSSVAMKEKLADLLSQTFGTRLKIAFAGGASLNYRVAQYFCGFGLPLLQIYGLTETAPVISTCVFGCNHPSTVGFPVPQEEVRLGHNNELEVRGPNIMKGYWGKPVETAAVLSDDGWFKTGDQADLSDEGRVRITGRIKEIIVTSTGEKIAPVDLEFAIQADTLFEQVLIIGEARAFISALVVVNEKQWRALCEKFDLDPFDSQTVTKREVKIAVLRRIRTAAKNFPAYGIPRAITVLHEAWTTDNGLLTPTLKLKRPAIMARFAKQIDEMYLGHENV